MLLLRQDLRRGFLLLALAKGVIVIIIVVVTLFVLKLLRLLALNFIQHVGLLCFSHLQSIRQRGTLHHASPIQGFLEGA